MKSIQYYIAGILVTGLPACELEEANINPNASPEASYDVLLPATQAHLVYAASYFASQTTATLVQYMSGTLNVQFNVTTYAYLPTNFQNTWNDHFYAGAMKDLRTIIELATEDEAYHYRGVARIQMAMALGYLVDLWGDVPYTQALDLETYPQPVYDPGEEVYEEIFRLLDEGIADLESESQLSPSDNDIYFPEGNVSAWINNSNPRWIKTANALKARYHNHLSKRDPEGSARAALDAISAGSFMNNDEELKVSYGSSDDAAGPWYRFLIGSFGQNNIAINQGFIDMLESRVGPGVDDPRLEFYVEPQEGEPYVGAPYGSTSMPSNVSVLGPYVNEPDAPTNLITYAEVKFIEAEAHYRLGEYGPAADAFNEAVKASIRRVTGSSDAAYEAVFASENAATIQVNGLRKIFTEKYIDMFLQTEAWADWRRSIPAGAAGTVSGIPELSAPPNNATQGVFPRRFLYPPSELDNNSANIPATSMTERVFWDQ